MFFFALGFIFGFSSVGAFFYLKFTALKNDFRRLGKESVHRQGELEEMRTLVMEHINIPGYDKQNAQYNPNDIAYERRVDECVVMPCCAFTFASHHTTADGSYGQCPNCGAVPSLDA